MAIKGALIFLFKLKLTLFICKQSAQVRDYGESEKKTLIYIYIVFRVLSQIPSKSKSPKSKGMKESKNVEEVRPATSLPTPDEPSDEEKEKMS